MEEENASYFEESFYSNQEDCRRQEAADRWRQEEEEDRRHQEQDLERQRQEEENRCRQEQDLEHQQQEEENCRRQEQDLERQRQQKLKGPTIEQCAMFCILYSKFMGQLDDYLDTILDSEEKLKFNAMYAKTFYGCEEQFIKYANLQKAMYNAHMLEWKDLRQNAVQFFMQIDFVGMEKCLKDAKEYVEQIKKQGIETVTW